MLNPRYTIHTSRTAHRLYLAGTPIVAVVAALWCSIMVSVPLLAQSTEPVTDEVSATQQMISVYKVPVKVQFGERMPTIQLRNVSLYRPLEFKNAHERVRFTRLMRDIKKTLPYAKMVSSTLKETYEYMDTLPDEKTKQKHLKRMEKELFQQFMPEMKKLTLNQGKLLMKLIQRETNSSSYQLLDSFLGSFAAGFWNMFANLFGGDLRTTWEPYGADAEIEHVCVLVEYGLV